MLIGITGGIGSGKSVISRILRLQGFPVYDTDLEARKLMEEIPHIRTSINEIVGQDVYSGGLSLDRALLAKHLFEKPEVRTKINCIVHSAVKDHLREWVNKNKTLNQWIFVESAILLSSGIGEMCEEIWLVVASDKTRIKRVMVRNAISEAQVKSRIKSQNDEQKLIDEARGKASNLKVIYNESDRSILTQIRFLLD